MRLTVEVPPDVEAGLLAQAEAQGLDMPHYVENVLRREATQPVAELFRPAAELTAEERLVHLRKFIEGHAGNKIVLSDEAMDRESIYEDRGL